MKSPCIVFERPLNISSSSLPPSGARSGLVIACSLYCSARVRIPTGAMLFLFWTASALLRPHALRPTRTAIHHRHAPAHASDASAVKQDLMSFLPRKRWGAPATNVTLDKSSVRRISKMVRRLEPFSPFAGVTFRDSRDAQEALSGKWRLIYSDASEITRLNKLPLGFRLGAVFQLIDTTGGRFENQAFVKHLLSLASAHTRVIAKFWLAEPGEINRVGVENAGNRANVKFERVVFSLRRLLVLPFFGIIKKVARPNGPSEKAGVTPCIDVTFLDDDLRISRGGDGSLFILERVERGPLAMMDETAAEMRLTEEKTYNAATDILPSGSLGRSPEA
jgi:hypothetical protein